MIIFIYASPSLTPARSYRAKISEAAPIGTKVTTVSATDDDDGDNALVRYFIADGDHLRLFKVDAGSGALLVDGRLDREAAAAFKLVVTAEDLGRPPLSANATVFVDVLDENDNYPVFDDPLPSTTTLSEATEVHSFVTSARATDADADAVVDAAEGNGLVYAIVDGNPGETFRIDARTSSVYLNQPVDYESLPTKTFRLNVSASDRGIPSKTAFIALKIAVEDANDNAPVFAGNDAALSARVPENEAPGAEVVRVRAEDLDSGERGRVSYSLVQQTPAGDHFRIDADTGAVYTKKPLDREAVDAFRLKIKARDNEERPANRKHAFKNVDVTVVDVNDCRPVRGKWAGMDT